MPHILIVEDNPDWTSTLKGFLVDAGYNESEITIAANEGEALSAIVQRPYVLAIVDVRLHGKEDDDSGISLALAIRKLSPCTKVIMQTGYKAQPSKVVRAIRYCGVADFIEKSQLGSDGDVDLALLVQRVLDKPEFEDQPEAGCLAIWLEHGHPLVFHARGEYVCINRTAQPLDLDLDKYRKQAHIAYTITGLEDRRTEVKDIGERIYKAIFGHPETLAVYTKAKVTNALMCLSFETCREMLGLPLEFLFDHDSGDYVVLDRPVYRFIAGVAPKHRALAPRVLADLPGKLRILLVASNTLPPIKGVDMEVAELAKSLRAHSDLVEIQLISTEEATHDRVKEEIGKWNPHVLHYAGHGYYDPQSPEESCLFFWPQENKDGMVITMKSQELKTLLEDSDIRLVYLSCCSGATTGEKAGLLHDDFLGLADAVVHGGVPTVLGYRWPVKDRWAPKLACAFYKSLLQQGHPAVALWQARRELAGMDKNNMTWLSPIMVHQA
jgi:CHAT domain-containing protein/ActR/RegA family two-component response regulator